MPYYVYRLKPFAQLQLLAEFPAYSDASQHAKAQRAAGGEGMIKLMFAPDANAAEDLLCQVRDPRPTEDD